MILFFPSLSPDGQHLLGESGTGYVVLDGQKLFVGFGPPVWRDQHSFIFSDELNPGVYLVGLAGERLAKLHDRPLIELAACPTKWAGRDPSRNVLVVSDGHEIVNAGQPSISPNGVLTFRTGDDKIEPSVCNTAEAWGEGAGLIFARSSDHPGTVNATVAGPEYRARLVDTPDGPWLLTMTHTALRLRPLKARDGFVRETGNNGNLNSHVVCVGRTLHVVYQDSSGKVGRWEQSIDAPREPFVDAPPPPPIDPPPPAMSTPNRLDVVRDEFSKQPPAPNSTESCGEFTRRVARRLHAEDANWGMLTKNPGEGQYQGFAVDALIYKPTQQVIDILAGAEGPNPQPAWQEVPKRDSNHWAVPPAGDDGDPGDENPPPPPPPDGSELRELREEVRALREALRMVDDRDEFAIQRLVQLVDRNTEALRVLALETRKLQDRKYKVTLSRDWGHSHRGTVEVEQ